MKKRQFSPEEKLAIVLEGLKGQRSVAEICREHQLSQSVFYRWRDKFLEGGKNALAYGAPSQKEARLKAEIEKLERIIGKQAIQIEVLKKTEELLGRD